MTLRANVQFAKFAIHGAKAGRGLYELGAEGQLASKRNQSCRKL